MRHLLNLPILYVVFASHVIAQDEDTTSHLDASDLPVTINVLQDVQINAVAENTSPDASNTLGRYSMVTLGIRKDQQFRMTDIHLHGGCQILFEDKHYDLVSCPWLPGFIDHQVEIFTVVRTCDPAQAENREDAACRLFE